MPTDPSKLKRVYIKTGRYKHFKGGMYIVLGQAVHTETGENLVVYIDELTGSMWVRPQGMFLETVERKPRFEFIGPGPETQMRGR